jgi:hypothetical protein
MHFVIKYVVCSLAKAENNLSIPVPALKSRAIGTPENKVEKRKTVLRMLFVL